jgi:methionine-gamma-lyase
MKRSDEQGFATKAIHFGHNPYEGTGSLTPPIHVSSTYAFETAEQGGRRFAGEEQGFIYSRLGNPTTSLLEARLAVLEGGEAACVTASGMGAISSLLWTLLRPGDELITDETLYGCTFAFFHKALGEFGIKVRHCDLRDPANFVPTPETKVLYFETPANPNMRVLDIPALSAAARQAGVWSVVDNTYLTPYLQRPIELGADFVVHSATKYLSGHGDLLAGAVIGPKAQIDLVKFHGVKDMTGSCLSAFDAHLLLRGLKTLNLRMDRHCASAMRIAEFLASRPEVKQVYYPGLSSDAFHKVAETQMKAFGGMMALELHGGLKEGIAFINALNLFTRAVSLGDCESLVEHPASMTHSTYTEEELLSHGIGPSLVRLSVGLEDVEDLIHDLDQALSRVVKRKKSA